MDEKWQRKVEALQRLAEDQKGKPEGELARQKAEEIMAKHGDSQFYQREYPGLWQMIYASYRQDLSELFAQCAREACARPPHPPPMPKGYRYQDVNARMEIWNEETKRWEPL